MRISSPAFEGGKKIPAKFTGDGDNNSPPLEWDAVPDATKEFALIMEDPDAPSAQPWVHWVLYKLAPEQRGIPAQIPPRLRPENPPGTHQGKNSWDTVGYRGPAPPRSDGPHRYIFKLYALDQEVDLPPEATKELLLMTIDNHVIETSELVGLYER